MQEIEQRVRSESGAELPEPKLVEGDVHPARGSLREIWNRPYRARTVLLIIFHVLQPVGYYGFASWVPTLLIAEGVNVTRSCRYSFVMSPPRHLRPPAGHELSDTAARN